MLVIVLNDIGMGDLEGCSVSLFQEFEVQGLCGGTLGVVCRWEVWGWGESMVGMGGEYVGDGLNDLWIRDLKSTPDL